MKTPEAVLSEEQNAESCLKRPQVLHSYAAISILFLLLWGTFWGIFGVDALPDGQLFAILLVIFLSYIGGQFIALFKFPPLLGKNIVDYLQKNSS